MKRLIASVATVLLVLTGQSSLAAPWSFDAGGVWQSGRSAVHIQEAYDVGTPSRVRLITRSDESTSRSDVCTSFPNEACTEDLLGKSYGEISAKETYPHKSLVFDLVMPACSVSTDPNWCIEDVRIYGKDANPTSASFLDSVTSDSTPAVPKWGIPAGGHISLWQASADSGLADLKVAAVVQATFVYYPFSGPNYVIQDFSVQIIPYMIDTSLPYRSIDVFESPENPGLGGNLTPSPGCVWQRVNECGKRIDSPADVRYGITLRSKVAMGQFFNGRLKDPNVQVETKSGVTELALDASPVTVGEFGLVYDSTPEIRAKMPYLATRGSHSTKAFYPNAMEIIDAFRNLAGDKSSGENTIWRVTAMGVSGLSRCYENFGIAGLVTTNATAYSGEPPRLQNGYLNYSVAGMHYLSNGTDLYVGTYDLVIRSEVARCLYGYSKAPVSATVTVVGESGQENIATTVVNEKDGWLKLAAYGFTFSEKEIKVQITQPQSKNLSKYSGRTTALSAKQKAEIKALVNKSKGNKQFICTGLRVASQPSLTSLVKQRATEACAYAKSLNRGLNTLVQVKVTKVVSQNGTVTVSSK